MRRDGDGERRRTEGSKRCNNMLGTIFEHENDALVPTSQKSWEVDVTKCIYVMTLT